MSNNLAVERVSAPISCIAIVGSPTASCTCCALPSLPALRVVIEAASQFTVCSTSSRLRTTDN